MITAAEWIARLCRMFDDVLVLFVVAFAMHPTPIEQWMAIADAGKQVEQ